ncbi:flocculation protein FLO11-like [Ananas comosus]|uniref:Flocculation protein FLO11-like n=1 Tax=Ananas comosus TaxID=4615 RepID=A0A6P5GQJ9_ANACO|nr:flocculation protein FLO11-like [Ananas comosus]
MNKSFRASEAQGAGTRGRTLGAVIKEKDEELALFLEMRKREREKERSNSFLLHHSSDELDLPPGSNSGSAPLFKIASSTPMHKTGIDDFLNSDSDKNDYDWLLTPPGTPLFPSLENESKRSPGVHVGTLKSRPTVLKSRLADFPDSSVRSTLASRQATSSAGLSSSTAVVTRRPSSSGGLTHTSSSRPATPTGRPTLTAVASKPLRPSTPTTRATIPSKPVVHPPRSSTPARSSTPTSSRPSIPAQSRPATARSSTPTKRPSTSTTTPPSQPTAASSAPPSRSSSIAKSRPTTTTSKGTSVPKSSSSRGSSPTVRSRPWKPSDMPGFSLDAPPNLRTSLPERPSSASRGRPGAPSSSRSSSVEPGPPARPRRQSCSPSRGRSPNGITSKANCSPTMGRSHLNSGDSVNPVLIGNKMVERVVNMRRLAPPKQEDQSLNHNNLAGKSSASPDSAGFGRTLSKKSLDMALRHMDIRRSIPNSLRPLMTNIPASSMYSVRSGPTRSRAVSVSDSPLATSSNASSEQSVNNTMICLDGTELEEDLVSEKGGRSSPVGRVTR